MTSQINPNDIDITYPVAGIDNDSQGFRDNFTNLKNNFTNAKNEIEDLQNKAVLKSALSGDSLDNDFADALVKGALFSDFSEVSQTKAETTGPVAFSHIDGHSQVVQSTTGSTTFTFTNFPAAGRLGRIRVQIDISDISHTVTLPAAVTIGIQSIAGLASNVITFNRIGIFTFEFTTVDAGTTIAINDLNRGDTDLNIPTRTVPTDVGEAGDFAGMTALDSTFIYFCNGNFDGATSIWVRVTLAASW